MNFDPLLTAPLAVRIHAVTVIPSFFLGTWLIFASKKGRSAHRRIGYLYMALMIVTAIAALFVHQLNPDGPFGLSWIHIFVPVTLAGIAVALYAALGPCCQPVAANYSGLVIEGQPQQGVIEWPLNGPLYNAALRAMAFENDTQAAVVVWTHSRFPVRSNSQSTCFISTT